MRPTRRHIESLVMRIQAGFLGDGTLSLTLPAAQQRVGVDPFVGAAVLGALVDAGVLTHREGVFHRHVPRPAVRRAA